MVFSLHYFITAFALCLGEEEDGPDHDNRHHGDMCNYYGNDGWGMWSEYGECYCGEEDLDVMVQVRHRECCSDTKLACSGEDVESRFCSNTKCPNSKSYLHYIYAYACLESK